MPSEWIITDSGRRFYPLNPDLRNIKIADIAHALSHQCRFSGHTKEFYSVADHCLRVAYECSDDNKLWALLHDASEAYLVDLPRPIKNTVSMANYLVHEQALMNAICEKFGLSYEMPDEVREADWLLCCTELKYIMNTREMNLSEVIEGWVEPPRYFDKVKTSAQAKEDFISLFNYLF